MRPEDVGNYLRTEVGAKLKRALTILEVAALRSIKKNFEMAGRPKWDTSSRYMRKKLARGGKPLVKTGNLSNVLAVSNEAELSVTLMSNPLARAYARIHQEGGTISHPAHTLRFRVKRYKGGAKRTVFASDKHKRISKETVSKPYVIHMKARPYMVIPPDDLSAIAQKIQKEM
jgi:phage gpG-like protein